jgi:hypothetical protein
MLFNSRAKRLGDYAAGTVVVREGSRRTLAAITADASADAAPSGLRSEDATLVRDFLLRRTTMQPGPRQHLAARLATALARRYALDTQHATSGSDEAFLEKLVGGTEGE